MIEEKNRKEREGEERMNERETKLESKERIKRKEENYSLNHIIYGHKEHTVAMLIMKNIGYFWKQKNYKRKRKERKGK